MNEQTKQPEVIERNLVFVRRYDDRLWKFCLLRHKQLPPVDGRKRAVPVNYRREGEEGWWFPKAWLEDFVDKHGPAIRSAPKPLLRDPATVDRILGRFGKDKELEAAE